VALQLKRHGVTRVRPLLGGLALWMERQFPVEGVPEPSKDTAASKGISS
jgi:3-mercaptopyruvate sulfurtransferase SseA